MTLLGKKGLEFVKLDFVMKNTTISIGSKIDNLQVSISFKSHSDCQAIVVFKDRKVLLWITLVLTYLRTYVQVNFMYVQVIFEGSHPTLKLTKQKMSEIIQVNVPIFFILTKSKK